MGDPQCAPIEVEAEPSASNERNEALRGIELIGAPAEEQAVNPQQNGAEDCACKAMPMTIGICRGGSITQETQG